MAYDVGARIGIEGEKGFKQAVSDINKDLSVLGSELKKVTAQFDTNSNSMDALRAKSDVYNKQIDAQKQKIETLKAALAESADKFGENDEKTKNWQIALNKAEAAVFDTERAIKQNNEALNKAQVATKEVSQDTDKFTGAAGAATQETMGFGDAVENLTQKLGINLPPQMNKSLNGLGELSGGAIVAVGAFAAMVAAVVSAEKALAGLTMEAAKTADEVMTLSMVTGLSSETIQRLKYSSELLDVSFDTVQSSMAKMIRTMGDAKEGTQTAVVAFERLGVSVVDNTGQLRDSEAVFYESIDALGRIENATERDAIAMDIFGRSAQDLNPLVIQGSDALKKYGDEAEAVGFVLDDKMQGALGDVDNAYQRMLLSQETITKQMAVQFAPHMEEALTDTRDFVLQIGEALIDSGAVDAFGSILESLTSLLDPLGSLITTMLPALQTVLDPLADKLAWIADTMNVLAGILTLDWQRVKTGLGLNISQGQMSNMQQRQYAGSTSVWDERLGAWVGNASASSQNSDPSAVYINEIKIDAKNVEEFNDVVRIVQNQKTISRMGGAL